ncbi:MAG: chemotaxis protein CheA, partial [Myxococcota bacterium]
MDKYRALFIEESREHLSELSRLLSTIEKDPEPRATVDECFRHIHSVKGMAASMGYDPIANLAHRLEDVIDVYRAAEARPPSSRAVDLFLRAVDALASQVESIAEKRALEQFIDLLRELDSEHASEDASDEASDDSSSVPLNLVVHLQDGTSAPSVRAFLVHRKVDSLARILSARPTVEEMRAGDFTGQEIVFALDSGFSTGAVLEAARSVPDIASAKLRAPETTAKSEGADERARAREPSATAQAPSTVRVRVDILDRLIDGIGELFIVRERLRALLGESSNPEIRAALDGLETRIREMHGQVLSVRMTPLRTLTDRYPRVVRDLARTLGKDVEFTVEGEGIELDRAILEALDTPFMHTLRNAVDHGVELPGERADARKGSPAKLSLVATRDRDTVVVTIEDDGRGLDADRLRDVAVERGLVTRDQADALSAREAHFLICIPGFSTKEAVSDVSGRGVGMDVVRAQIESLSGTLDIDSERGRGTRFIFRLPLTLAIINALLIEAAGRRFAVPVGKVVAVREVGDDGVDEAGGARYL